MEVFSAQKLQADYAHTPDALVVQAARLAAASCGASSAAAATATKVNVR